MIYDDDDDDDCKEHKDDVLRILTCVRNRNSSISQIKERINQNQMA
jgi:hypothetical protein